MLERLRELRLKNNYTLEEVAKKLNLKNQYVSNYELGKRRPDYETLLKFANLYHVSVDYLLGNESPKGPSPAVIMGFRGPGQITVPDKKKSDKHQELLQLLDGLSDEQINVLIQVAQSMK